MLTSLGSMPNRDCHAMRQETNEGSCAARNPEPDGAVPAAAWKTQFRRRILSWFRANARDLPWRKTRDPYAVWVSEIMLQQTQVATVIGYFERFLAAFPAIADLAAADDIVYGGAGHDRIYGGAGADRVYGDAGDDWIAGGDGDDPLLRGGDGNDRISGGNGRDRLYGDAGFDTLYRDTLDYLVDVGAGGGTINSTPPDPVEQDLLDLLTKYWNDLDADANDTLDELINSILP
jgi:Ca2+-binding RTX toxin-like protein